MSKSKLSSQNHFELFVCNLAHRIRRDVSLLIPLLMLFGAEAISADAQYLSERDHDRLETYVGMFNELAERRQRVIYTDYPVSPFYGITNSFVHVSSGSAAFARTDLVVDAAMPIIIRRGYHSDRSGTSDLGNGGWHLTVLEHIQRTSDGGILYRYGNGATLNFDRGGKIIDPAEAFVSDVMEVKASKENMLTVITRTGLRKTFKNNNGTYRLSQVTDGFGNALSFHYRKNMLQRIVSSDGASVALQYDSQDRLRSVEDSNNRKVVYNYDDTGQLVTVVDVREQLWRYIYSNSGKLMTAVTPNGESDIEFAYDDVGRVVLSTRNGLPIRFEYDGPVTTATDAEGRDVQFTSNEKGLTTDVVNALGVHTSIEFMPDGLPDRIMKDGEVAAKISYRDSRRAIPKKIVMRNSDSTTAELSFDREGRISQARTQEGSTLFRILSYGVGLRATEILGRDSAPVRIQYDENGNLSSFNESVVGAWSFQRDAATLKVTGPHQQTATLQFNSFGQLANLQPKQGSAISFEYDNDGLRSKTETSDGIEIDYRYDSSGNLFSTSVGYRGDEKKVFSYILESHNRLNQIVSGGKVYASFEYNALGSPVATNSPLLVDLAFHYDGLGRLETIIPEGGVPITYNYAPGEPDIARQLDSSTAQSIVQMKETSDFATRSDIFLSRIAPSNYGFITYDSSSGEIKVFVDPMTWTPESQVQDIIANTKLKFLFSESGPDYAEFSKASNRFFIPAEFWAINCCFCCNSSNGGVDCQIP